MAAREGDPSSGSIGRLARSALLAGLVVAMADLVIFVVRDLPGTAVGPAGLLVLVLPPAIGLVLGWRDGGIGAIGAALGALLGVLLAGVATDAVAGAIDPGAVGIGSGTEGATVMLVLAGVFLAAPATLVAGLVGWLARSVTRR